MIVHIAEAIKSLYPSAEFYMGGDTYESVVWVSNDIQQPSKEAVEAEVARLQTEYNTQQYARQRAQEYPSIGDQLDALFHAGLFPEDMAAKLQAVKDKYPKV